MNCILIIMTTLLSCSSEQSDLEGFDKKVQLEKEDFKNFNELKNQLLVDLIEIRKISKKMTSADTTFLSTNNHYLFQINKDIYQPILKKLQDKEIFKGTINTSHNGTLIFTLKERFDDTNLPHFIYSHDLVWNAKPDFSPPYSGTIEVLLDSNIDENWKYVYYRAQVGH